MTKSDNDLIVEAVMLLARHTFADPRDSGAERLTMMNLAARLEKLNERRVLKHTESRLAHAGVRATTTARKYS